MFTGAVPRYTFNGMVVTNLPDGLIYPKYVAYPTAGGAINVISLGSNTQGLSISEDWMLVWFGANSTFTDSIRPLTYSGGGYAGASLPHTEAYLADIPVLIKFQTNPSSIKHSSEGGIELTFSDSAGYMIMLPLYGRKYLPVSTTESWSTNFPQSVTTTAQWWASRLNSFPISVSETISYDQVTDKVSFTENIELIKIKQGGTLFVPVPPMLALSSPALNVQFSRTVVNSQMATEFGPYWGFDNVSSYKWELAGLDKFIERQRLLSDPNLPLPELDQEISQQVDRIIAGGHFAPWIYSDHLPKDDVKGNIYWLNPADEIYQLVEIAGALKGTSKKPTDQLYKK